MLWEVQISKMANSLATFPSLLPRIADDLWFTLEKRLDDDAALTKEEEQYTALVRLPILSLLILLLIFLWNSLLAEVRRERPLLAGNLWKR